MFQKLKARYITYMGIALTMFIVLAVQLYGLTTTYGKDEETAQSATLSEQKTVYTTGSRGSILDANGIPLAYDVDSYDVEFYKDPAENASSDRANYTQIIRKTIELIEKNGGKTIDTFLIRKNEEGEFEYNVSGLEGEARETRIANWRENMQIDENLETPEEIYYELRSRYRIPEDVEYDLAVKILSIWQESQLMSYRSYIPVPIAYNVDFNTVSEIETRAFELKGMQIAKSSIRTYPYQATAAHLIGYLGKMVDESEIEKYVDQEGYSPEDLVGKVGLEATMESYLTGSSKDKQGKTVLEVDENGTVTGTVSSEPTKQGDSVVLNIDLKMQQVLEKALEENIKLGREEQLATYQANKEEYDEELASRSKKELDLLQSGAAIVMEVDTGKILAMASYPSYDLNLFTGGISQEDFQKLLDDPATPLFNNAISSTSTPGSVFKMLTAVAGLMEGEITVDTIINDEGPYDKYIQDDARAPACWVKPNFKSHANNQNVVAALKNSCNYFFYEVADRLGIERLNAWADKFGVTSKTNIELTGEAVGWVGNQQVLYDNTKPLDEQRTYKPLLVYNKLKEQLKGFGEELDVTYTDEQITAAADRIIVLAGGGTTLIGEDIRKILSEELDIHENLSSAKGWSVEIVNTILELMWTPTDTVTQGIGVTPTQLTPIAVTRYICALVNGGKVLEPQLVDKVVDAEGNVVLEKEPVVVTDMELPDSVTSVVMEGMEQVVSWENRGTAAAAFLDFEYRDLLAGKTGTAPVSDIDLEDNVWLALVAPKDDPEIAVVAFMPHGLSDSKAYPTVTAVLQYYFDSKKLEEQPTPEEGTLVVE